MSAEAPERISKCGPCSTRQHDRCIPTVPSLKGWHCGCDARGHKQ